MYVVRVYIYIYFPKFSFNLSSMHCAYVYSEFLVDESSIDEILWGYGETRPEHQVVVFLVGPQNPHMIMGRPSFAFMTYRIASFC